MAQRDRIHKIENQGDFKVIVAIDFGTHGTGIGYAIIDQDQKEPETYIEQDWCQNADKKNKTDILLSPNGQFLAFGEKALEQYMNLADEFDGNSSSNDDDIGPDAPSKPMLFESFKMALYRSDAHFGDGDIRDVVEAKDGRKWNTGKVFIEALKCMKRHILSTFHRKQVRVKDTDTGQLRPIQGIADIQWILTVPAIWSDRAKFKMERWSQTAGLIGGDILDHLRIVYEPDCASISCQYEAVDEEQDDLKQDNSAFAPGTRYILIDAGGGTVDIACHQVLAEMEMEEIHRPTGGPWGSDYMDGFFDELLDEIFGQGTVDKFRRSRPAVYTKIVDNFRKSKMLFYSNANVKRHKVQLHMDFMDHVEDESSSALSFGKMLENATPFGLEKGHFGLEEDTLWMSREVWSKHLFDRIIDPMIGHVQELIEEVNQVEGKDGTVAKVKYLCLAGGLSSSKYFQHRIHESFGIDSPYGLSIRIPRRPILSVIDGALKLGLKPSYIKTRRVKYTYGIAVDRSEKNVKVDRLPDGYLERNTYIHEYTKRRTVRNLFSAFIRKNEPIDLERPIEKEYRRFSKDEESSKISLYFSGEADPYVIQEGQQPLASVKITFPKEYNGLKFIVQFFFGDTKLRAKVNYRSKKGGDEEQEFPLEELELEYHGLDK